MEKGIKRRRRREENGNKVKDQGESEDEWRSQRIKKDMSENERKEGRDETMDKEINWKG